MKKRADLRVLMMIIIPFILVLAPLLIGQWYGIYRSALVPDLQRVPVGSITGAAFALLAFLLAFTFQIAASRFDARKKLLLDEITNIRSTYLRAEFLMEPFITNMRKYLVEYVNIRVEIVTDLSKLDYAISRSRQILDNLWMETAKMTQTNLSPAIFSLFATSVNNLVDNFNQRITLSFEYRIPPLVFWALFFVTFFCMLLLGFQFGLSGKGNFIIFLLLTLIFSTVMFLILVLDNPKLSRLNQKPLLTLKDQLIKN
jgi:hypothetical protein